MNEQPKNPSSSEKEGSKETLADVFALKDSSFATKFPRFLEQAYGLDSKEVASELVSNGILTMKEASKRARIGFDDFSVIVDRNKAGQYALFKDLLHRTERVQNEIGSIGYDSLSRQLARLTGVEAHEVQGELFSERVILPGDTKGVFIVDKDSLARYIKNKEQQVIFGNKEESMVPQAIEVAEQVGSDIDDYDPSKAGEFTLDPAALEETRIDTVEELEGTMQPKKRIGGVDFGRWVSNAGKEGLKEREEQKRQAEQLKNRRELLANKQKRKKKLDKPMEILSEEEFEAAKKAIQFDAGKVETFEDLRRVTRDLAELHGIEDDRLFFGLYPKNLLISEGQTVKAVNPKVAAQFVLSMNNGGIDAVKSFDLAKQQRKSILAKMKIKEISEPEKLLNEIERSLYGKPITDLPIGEVDLDAELTFNMKRKLFGFSKGFSKVTYRQILENL